MFCKKCGAQIKDGDAFCGGCGEPVKKKVEEPKTEQPTPPVEEDNKDINPELLAYQKMKNGQGEAEPVVNNEPNNKPENNDSNTEEVKPYFAVKEITGSVNNVKGAIGDTAQNVKNEVNKKLHTTVKLKKSTLKYIGIALGGLLVLIIIFSSIAKSFDSEHAAKKFAKSMLNQNWDTTFSMLRVENSDFVNKEKFKEFMVNNPQYFLGNDTDIVDVKVMLCPDFSYENISDYVYSNYSDMDINDFSDQMYKNADKGNLTQYTAAFISSTGSYNEITFNVIKNKGFLFFCSYDITLQTSPITTYTIYAPEGCTVKVDGIEVPYQSNDEYESSYYMIDQILPGEYTLSVTRENCQPVEEKIVVSQSSDNSYSVSLKTTEEFANNIVNTGIGYAQAIITACANETGTVENVPYYDDDIKSNFDEFIARQVENLKNDSNDYRTYSITTVSNFTTTNDYDDFENLEDSYTVYFKFDYAYKETYKGGTTPEVNDRNNSSSGGIDLKFVDGKWTVYSINFTMYR